MILPIVIGADAPVLRTKAQPVSGATKEVLKLVKDMQETLKHAKGAGLAAPQVGMSQRVILAQIGRRTVTMINPDILSRSTETAVAEEGCLSLPGLWTDVPRAVAITVRYVDEKGQPQERKLENMDARVVQHEVDHLNGVLIVDYR